MGKVLKGAKVLLSRGQRWVDIKKTVTAAPLPGWGRWKTTTSSTMQK